jgi:UDP-N-acetylmuramoyl-L-alanyl-D-glutamate--2,6-diaminopimelate ligase
MTATLGDIRAAVGVAPGPESDLSVVEVSHDSRVVGPGWLFCCVPGATVDGHRFASGAVAAGAAALLVERPLGCGVPEIVVDDVRAAMGPAAAVVHGRPSDDLTVVGVTGTNGKSSVVQILADIWTAAGRPAEIHGTLTGARTTAEAPDLQRALAAAVAGGTTLVAMEVSSHALSLHRVAGTRFAAAVFTNLSQDHLDFHHDLGSYFRAKASLFRPELASVAVANRDDPYGARLLAEVAAAGDIPVVPFGLDDLDQLRLDGAAWAFSWRGRPVRLRLVGRHNLANALAAATTAEALDLPADAIVAGLEATEPVRGRFELVEVEAPFQVVVDYAHTPDALEAVLTAAREVAEGRVILVFGCGGDRDEEKRPEMGRVAQRGADLVVVTSDNPRSEDPATIIDAVTAGMDPGVDREPMVEPDRRRAIAAALGAAEPGDLVLVAGKGHETVQQIGGESLPFDDRAVAIEELGALA